jgi:hypothetical protein
VAASGYAATVTDPNDRLPAGLAEQTTLAAVFAWAREQEPPWQLAEVVGQDEFTRDLVLAGPEGRYVVLDIT